MGAGLAVIAGIGPGVGQGIAAGHAAIPCPTPGPIPAITARPAPLAEHPKIKFSLKSIFFSS